MIENQSYSGFVLWLRGTKPYMEKLGSDTAATVVGVVNPLLASARSTVLKYNPDLQRVRKLSRHASPIDASVVRRQCVAANNRVRVVRVFRDRHQCLVRTKVPKVDGQ
eukprot:Selendium_serpulae@DN6338_c4_g1_i15.p4